ncbi:hypothetical protein HK099_001858, partial [Clydaea vesicula]
TPYHQKISDILKSQKLNKLLSDLLKFEASRENRHLNAQDDKVFLFKEKINYKLAGAAGFPAHQDAPAFMQLGEPMHVSMMIAVDEATKENGCLEVVRGSHLSNILPQMEDGSIHEDWCKDKLWEPVTCKPGDCLIFGSYLAHRSGPNNSSKNRSAFYFTFNDQNSGDLRESYYNEKREKFPPMIDRIDGKDYSNDLRQSNGKLFPVPVRIQNFLQEGVYVNLQKSEISSTPMDNSIASALFTDFGDDRLTRRFFLVDTLSGVQDGKLMVLRVATKIKVWITKSPRADGQIYSPIVDIYYSERHAPELALNDNSLFSSLVFNFEVIYRMDQSYFWSIMLIIFVILSLVATFLAFYEAKKFSSFNLEPQDVNQCRIDIFFMDWEKSKGKVIHHLQHDASETTLNTSSVRDVPISIWRTIFVANQWNALQSFRRINVTFTLVLMFSLMYGIKLRYLATPQPDATNLSVDKTNPILLFSINTVIWGALCTVQ